MKPFLLFLFMVLTSKIFSQEWIYVGQDIKGNKTYCQSQYVSKGGNFGNENIYKVWTKKVCKSTFIYKNGKNVAVNNVYILCLSEYDCSEKREKIIYTSTYNVNGNLITSYKVPEYLQEWDEIVPESIGKAIINKICELFN